MIKYGDDATEVFANYGDKAVEAVSNCDSKHKALKIIKEGGTQYGEQATQAIKKSGDKAVEALTKVPSKECAELIVKYGDDGVEIVSFVEKNRFKLKTNKGTAFFWSGKTDGIGGEEVAKKIAKDKGGTTLELLIENNRIDMPEWSNDPIIQAKWGEISRVYAEQVEGEVHAVIGDNLREGNIWETFELPRLINNSKVTKIIKIDPKTLKETVIFMR